MTKKLLFLGVLWTVLQTAASAQLKYIQSTEIRNTLANETNQVRLVGSDGLYFIKNTRQIYNQSTLWNITRIDTALNLTWSKMFLFESKYFLLGVDTLNREPYLLYQNMTKRQENTVLYFNKEGEMFIRNFRINVPMQVTHFKMIDKGRKVLLGGYFNYRPIAILYDFNTRIPRVLPGLFNSVGKLLDLVVSEEYQSIDLLLYNEQRGVNKGMWLLTYDFDGDAKKLINLNIFDPRKTVNNAKVLRFSDDRHILAGGYGRRGSEYSKGFYYGIIDDKIVYQKFIPFASLPNFFNYTTDRRRKRIERRIERKASKGKETSFTYKLALQEMAFEDNELRLIGESYYVKYRSSARYGTSGFGMGRYNSLIFDGYGFTHSFALGLNGLGEVKWDLTINTKNQRNFDLERFIEFHSNQGQRGLFYTQDGIIKYTDKKLNEDFKEPTDFKIKSQNPNDELRNNGNDLRILHWYGNTFLVFGDASIRNSKDVGIPLIRRNFLLSKYHYTP